jgi:hypothetical protein
VSEFFNAYKSVALIFAGYAWYVMWKKEKITHAKLGLLPLPISSYVFITGFSLLICPFWLYIIFRKNSFLYTDKHHRI